MHNLMRPPKGLRVADILPVFRGVKYEIRLGKPDMVCAGCRRSFNTARKRRKRIRLYPCNSRLPIVYEFHLCGVCASVYQRGGDDRAMLLAAIESYWANGAEGGDNAQSAFL